jgi:hypothetical protein
MASASKLLGDIYSFLSDVDGRELARACELDVEAFMRGQRERRLRDAERAHNAVKNTPTRALPRPALRPCPICDLNVDWDLFEKCSSCDIVMHHVCYYGRVATVDEWRTFLRIADSKAGGRIWPEILCPACRGRGQD